MNSVEDSRAATTIANEYRRIDVDDIDDVAVNPRYKGDGDEVFNESYQELKESLYSSKGRYLVLEVVERNELPGHYTIFKGGSTRLRILKELANKERLDGSGHRYFESVNCIVYPKIEESVKLVMTATENITRGDLCYGEKCRALQYIVAAYHLEKKQVSGSFSVAEFLEYAEMIGAKGMIPNRREYNLLQSCYDHFLASNILNKKLINGRANREFVRNIIAIRSKFMEYCDSMNLLEKDLLWATLCDAIDDSNLTIKVVEKAFAEFKAQVATDQPDVFEELAEDKWHVVAGDVESQLGDDPRGNAEVLIAEILTTGCYSASRKKTNKLKAMGITNDLAGFVKLVQLMPRKQQRETFRLMLDGGSR